MRKTAVAVTLIGLLSNPCARIAYGQAPATAAPRERPAMVPCPWPAAMGDTVGPDTAQPPAPTCELGAAAGFEDASDADLIRLLVDGNGAEARQTGADGDSKSVAG